MADSQPTVIDDDYHVRDEQLRALAAIHGDIAAPRPAAAGPALPARLTCTGFRVVEAPEAEEHRHRSQGARRSMIFWVSAGSARS